MPSQAPAIEALEWIGAFILIALIVWRFKAGALKSGYQDLLSNLRTFAPPWKRAWRRLTRGRRLAGVISPTTPLGMTLWGTLVAAFLATGFTAVPPEAVGYGRLFGAVVWRDLPPGLHYLAPRPLVRVDHWPVREVKSVTNDAPYEYLSGESNLLALSVNLQYLVRDPYVYHYRTEDPERVITDSVRDEVRAFVGAGDLNHLLNVRREELEAEIHRLFAGSGGEPTTVLQAVDLIKVNLVAIQPIGETMSAFREISSSQEDRERFIVNAQRFMVSLIPRAHGNAIYEVEQAAGEAFRNVTASAAEADAIRVVSRAVQEAPEVLQNMLWREKTGDGACRRQLQDHRPESEQPRQGGAVEEIGGDRRSRPTEGARGLMKRPGILRNRIVAAVVVLIIVVVAADSLYIIDEAQQGVLTHFGKIRASHPPARPAHQDFRVPLRKSTR